MNTVANIMYWKGNGNWKPSSKQQELDKTTYFGHVDNIDFIATSIRLDKEIKNV